MYQKLIKVDTPRIFFKHELEQLSDQYARSYRPGYKPKYFTFLDKDGKLADKVLYEPYDNLDDRKYYGNQICVMKRCEEERYSQSVIDSCRQHYKKTGFTQYEWHLVKKPSVFKGSFRINSFIRSGNRYNTFQVYFRLAFNLIYFSYIYKFN